MSYLQHRSLLKGIKLSNSEEINKYLSYSTFSFLLLVLHPQLCSCAHDQGVAATFLHFLQIIRFAFTSQNSSLPASTTSPSLNPLPNAHLIRQE